MTEYIELLGISATILIAISLTRSKQHEMRLINTSGSILFVIYGLFIHSTSVALLNFIIIVINLFKLIKDSRGEKQ